MLKKINNEDAINERDIMKNIKWLKKSNLFVFLALYFFALRMQGGG